MLFARANLLYAMAALADTSALTIKEAVATPAAKCKIPENLMRLLPNHRERFLHIVQQLECELRSSKR